MKRSIHSTLPFYAVILLWGFGSGLLTPVLPLYARTLGFSINDWGLLVTVYAASTFIFEWMWGALSDRIDRRAFIAAGLLSGSALTFLYTLKAFTPFLYVLQFIRGATFIMVGPAVKALVSDLNSSGGIGLSMGLYSSVRRLGSVVGPIVGTLIAQTYSYESALHVYSIVYVIGALATITIQKGEAPSPRETETPGIREDFKALLEIRAILVLFAVPVIIYMGGTVIGSFLPIYAQEVVGMSTVGVGALFSVGNIAGFLTTPVFGWLSDRHGRSSVVLTCFILSTAAMFGISLASTPLQLTASLIFFTMCFSPLTPLLLAMLTEATPGGLLGTSMGIYSTFENLGIVLTPPVYSLIWTAYAPSAIFVFGALTQILGILLILTVRKRTD
ncbi:MAG TPA: MFS transporter [Patescibacteria group bacterium]|nr:MFS transporter [Patescibacteria group bacterium]